MWTRVENWKKADKGGERLRKGGPWWSKKAVKTKRQTKVENSGKSSKWG